MAKTLTLVNPAVLRWARERGGHSVEDVALRLKRAPEVIEAWERGEGAPTYVQLEKLAYKVYNRPVAVFFFPEPPDEPDLRQSFRTLPQAERDALAPTTRLLLREAQARQIALMELTDGENPANTLIFRDIELRPGQDVPAAAQQVRAYLGVSVEEQTTWRSTRAAADSWRDAVQDKGVFIFKAPFKQRDISGFCLLHDEFPVIYLNNGNSLTRQTFSIFHELGHLLLGTAGVTLNDDSFLSSMRGVPKAVEVFCNRFAAEVLLPGDEIDGNDPESFQSDSTVQEIAERYCVSREMVLRRALDKGWIARNHYEQKAREWNEEYEYRQERGTGGGGGNYYHSQAAYLGQSYMRLAFGEYYRGRLSASELADYLGVRASSLDGLEAQVRARGT
jgi:Zn-dependent peptidase ImmA (M78 family)